MGRFGSMRTRRDVIKGALAGGAYVAPAIVSASLPEVVSAATPPPTTPPPTVAPPLPVAADLTLAKTVNAARPNVGETITFALTLGNNGPNAATGVAVTDRLPASLAFVSSTPSQGTYDPAAGIWTVGALAVGAVATLAIRATVTAPGAMTNTATTTGGAPPDPVAANNSASVIVTPQQADLALTKVVSNPSPLPRNTATFLTTLTNAGPDAATNVTVADAIPAGTSFVSATPSQGTYSSAAGLWTVGTLAAGASATLRLTVVFTPPLPAPLAVTNQASVAHSDPFDPVAANNSATATYTPPGVALLVDVSAILPAAPHNIAMNLFNLGTNGATNVVVRVAVNAPYTLANLAITSAPPGTTFVAVDARTALLTIPSLPSLASAALTFDAPGPPGTLTLTATVVDVDQFDAGPGTFSDSVPVV